MSLLYFCVFYGVFITEEVDRVAKKGLRDTRIASWRPFWTCFWDLPVSLMKLFFWWKQHFWSWDYCPQVSDYQDLQIIGHLCWITGILIYLGSKDMAAAIHDHGTRWRWVVSVMAQPFYHQRKTRCCSLTRTLWGFHSYVGYCALLGIKTSSSVVQSTA